MRKYTRYRKAFDCDSNKPQCRESNSRRHSSYLSIPSFCNRQFDPGCWNVCSETDRWIPFRQPVRRSNCPHNGGRCYIVFFFNSNAYACSQLLQCFIRNVALNLNQICTSMFVYRVKQFFSQGLIVC